MLVLQLALNTAGFVEGLRGLGSQAEVDTIATIRGRYLNSDGVIDSIEQNAAHEISETFMTPKHKRAHEDTDTPPKKQEEVKGIYTVKTHDKPSKSDKGEVEKGKAKHSDSQKVPKTETSAFKHKGTRHPRKIPTRAPKGSQTRAPKGSPAPAPKGTLAPKTPVKSPVPKKTPDKYPKGSTKKEDYHSKSDKIVKGSDNYYYYYYHSDDDTHKAPKGVKGAKNGGSDKYGKKGNDSVEKGKKGGKNDRDKGNKKPKDGGHDDYYHDDDDGADDGNTDGGDNGDGGGAGDGNTGGGDDVSTLAPTSAIVPRPTIAPTESKGRNNGDDDEDDDEGSEGGDDYYENWYGDDDEDDGGKFTIISFFKYHLVVYRVLNLPFSCCRL